MTMEDAILEQEEIVRRGFNLGWWFGTNCRKCCSVFPRLIANDHDCWYQCPVCGQRTEPASMPWIAEEAWNSGRFRDEILQISFEGGMT